METLEHEDSALWGDLEAQFEGLEEAPLAFNPGEAPTRRRTPAVALQQAVFSGFLPMLVLCWAGALWSIQEWQPHMSALVLLGCLGLSVPLALVLGPHLRGPRKHLASYLGIGILAGGVGNLAAYLADLWQVQISWTFFSSHRAIELFEEHLETFFSLGHLGIMALAGCIVAFSMVRCQKSLPWLDGKEFGRVRSGLAWLCLLLPLLVPSWFAGAGLLQERELEHWRDQAPAISAPKYVREPELDDEWNKVARDWIGLRPDALAQKSLDELEAAEQSFLTLINTQREMNAYPTHTARSLGESLRGISYKLHEPTRVALGALELNLRLGSSYSNEHRDCYQNLFNDLQTGLTGETPLEELQQELLTIKAGLDGNLQGIDQTVNSTLSNVHHTTRGDGIDGLDILVWEVKQSPGRWFEMRKYLSEVRWWFSIRPKVVALSPEGQMVFLRGSDHGEVSLARDLARRLYPTDHRQLMEAADLLLACRRYRNLHGQWPASAEDLTDLVSSGSKLERWTLAPNGSKLQVRDNLLSAMAKLPGPQLAEWGQPRVPSEWVLQ